MVSICDMVFRFSTWKFFSILQLTLLLKRALNGLIFAKDKTKSVDSLWEIASNPTNTFFSQALRLHLCKHFYLLHLLMVEKKEKCNTWKIITVRECGMTKVNYHFGYIRVIILKSTKTNCYEPYHKRKLELPRSNNIPYFCWWIMVNLHIRWQVAEVSLLK